MFDSLESTVKIVFSLFITFFVFLETEMKLLLFTLPLITWSYFFYTWYTERKRNEEDTEYERKNNCVITYALNRNMRGWDEASTATTIDSLTIHFSPLLYFITTTKKSLDIAMMNFTIKVLIDALLELKKKGVKIRIVVDSLDNRSILKEAGNTFLRLLKLLLDILLFFFFSFRN